jgi:hypothetical protein
MEVDSMKSAQNIRKALGLAALALAVAAAALAAALVGGASPESARAASHREAPLISLDPEADITDFFMFRSYEPGQSDKTVLIMDTIPGEEPSSGPNYYAFDPSVLYAFNLDTNGDGKAGDIRFEFRFENELRGTSKAAGLFLPYVAVPGPITKLDGPGSEGLGLRQRYTVTMVKGDTRTKLASGLIAAPPNVGPRTMPNYADLASQAMYSLPGGGRVFAGQRQDPFYIDLGAVFDTLNLRRVPLPLETAAEDANDRSNAFGIDMLAGFNVHTIALEVPTAWLTGDNGATTIGAYASTSRQKVSIRADDGNDSKSEGPWIQVQRLANPLVNETIIGTADKDRWNALAPDQEKRFEDYYLNPRLALALELVTGVPAAKANRTDLRDLLLKYQSSDRQLSELLRLNVSVPPTPYGSQKRLGPLAHDAAGNPTPDPAAWPNGRRPIDDVTDVAVRVVGGPNYIAGLAADGINTDDAALSGTFPFLATPADGVNRVHQNP